jgi:hypothetical protein
VNPTWHNLYISFLFEFFSLALSQLKIEPDFSYLATTAQAPPQIQKLPPAQIKSYTLELLRATLGKNSQRALRTPVVHFRYRPTIRPPKVLGGNAMKTDTFIRHLSLQAAAAETCSAGFFGRCCSR